MIDEKTGNKMVQPGPTSDLLAMQRRQVALDMALRYFTGRTPETIVKSAAVFEAYLKGESA